MAARKVMPRVNRVWRMWRTQKRGLQECTTYDRAGRALIQMLKRIEAVVKHCGMRLLQVTYLASDAGF